jgi:hypothetical protein
VKFKHDRRRLGKEHELLSLEEAMFLVDVGIVQSFCC